MSTEVGGQVAANDECATSSDDTDNTVTGATEGAAAQLDPGNDDKSDRDLLTPEDVAENDTSLPDFSIKSWKEDLTLIVEGKKLFVSSSTLAYMSPVFSTMFEEKFATDGPREIEMPGKKYFDFVEFLRCIHPTIWKPVTMENASIVLPLVNEYKVDTIKERIEQVLVANVNEDQTPSNICMLAREASKHEMKLLFASCIPLLAKLDQNVLRDAENEMSLPFDVKYNVEVERNFSLNGTIDTLTLELEKSKSRVKSLEQSIKDLEEMVKALWNNDGGKLSIRDNKIGVVRLIILKPNPTWILGQKVSSPIELNGLKLSIAAYMNSTTNHLLCVDIKAETPSNVKLWTCKLLAKLRILRRDIHKTHFWSSTSGKIKSSKPHITFNKLISFGDLWSVEYIMDNKVDIEVFILVEDVFVVP